MQNISKIFEKYIFPAFLAIFPFSSNIASWLESDNVDYIYEVKYTKNPMLRWNEQVGQFLDQLGKPGEQITADQSNFVMRKVGEEVKKSMPAILAGYGFHPSDSYDVTVYNVSHGDLKNITVNLLNCRGYTSHQTSPDSFSKVEHTEDSATFKYDKISPSSEDGYTYAKFTFYGRDASSCKASIDVERNGVTLRGKEQGWDDYWRSKFKENEIKNLILDFTFKAGYVLLMFYLWWKIRKLERSKQLSSK